MPALSSSAGLTSRLSVSGEELAAVSQDLEAVQVPSHAGISDTSNLHRL